MNKQLQLFLVGSSVFITFPFYILTYFISIKKYDYLQYILICPLGFGFWNIFFEYLFYKYPINYYLKILIIATITSFTTCSRAYLDDLYDVDKLKDVILNNLKKFSKNTINYKLFEFINKVDKVIDLKLILWIIYFIATFFAYLITWCIIHFLNNKIK